MVKVLGSSRARERELADLTGALYHTFMLVEESPLAKAGLEADKNYNRSA